ncbi:D-hexose-6-phosphate mutarotase [Derxia gummosa]|uniref:Putative glucose-6-phosphate 1-epimerase n=1 Tax=Derxia gummosa DSM 723 TaxID=1121388 RepID=A0A8B6XAV1_9BURK|nr:D-hexose-6-phosphate mutarotase [Derxia gummosa]
MTKPATAVPPHLALPVVELVAADGARCTIAQQGAHVLSWTPAGGAERLFLSQKAEYAAGVAIRGGIPVIFPQFAGEGPMPKHGFARTAQWKFERIEQAEDGAGIAHFSLTHEQATHALWPHHYAATLTVRVGGERLAVTLGVRNTGPKSFSFTAALHTYLRVSDIALVQVMGLDGLSYRDTADGGALKTAGLGPVEISGEVDRIYLNAPSPLVLREQGGDLHVHSEGFADAVVWNPGAVKGAALADLDAGGYARFLCIESAAIGKPVKLAAGARWTGTQTLVAR